MFAPTKPTLSAIGKLLGFLITLITWLHIFACVWANIGKENNSWVSQVNNLLSDNSESTLYLTSLYWASTIFATVGYGDIYGYTTLEYVFTMFIFVSLIIMIVIWCLYVLISSWER